MTLRQPVNGTGRPHHRIELSMTSSDAAAEVVACAGGILRVSAGEGHDTATVVHDVLDETVFAGGHLDELRLFRPGRHVVVSWTEVNDWATLPARIEEITHDRLSIACEWPPAREQRREFRRFAMDLPLWICRGVLHPVVLEGRTRDLSGGGIAASVPSHGCEVGDAVVAVVRSGARDVTTAARVQWVRASTSLLGLEFDALTPADQDHMVGLVAQAETRRGW